MAITSAGGGGGEVSERTEDRTRPSLSGGRFSGPPREGMTPLFAWILRHSESECRTKGFSDAWQEESSATVPR
jgi:hypothetical protein